jgi:WD40 repeat protein
MPDETANRDIPPGFKLLYMLPEHKDVIHWIDWSPDGLTLALASAGASICLWDAQSGTQS